MKYLTLIVSALLVSNGLSGQDFRSTKAEFTNLVEYLTAGSGQWTFDNPDYDMDDPASSKGIGLWFTKSLQNNLLLMTHVVFKQDTAHITGRSFWLWHPGEHRIKYYSLGFKGHFTEGETYFLSEKEFATYEFTYAPDGKIEVVKDVNLILSEDTHRTTMAVFRDHDWTETGDFHLQRKDISSYYKVVKDD